MLAGASLSESVHRSLPKSFLPVSCNTITQTTVNWKHDQPSCVRSDELLVLGLKKRNCLFPVTVWKKRVGGSVKKKFTLFFWSKMCVLCMFYVDWELGRRKKLMGRDFFE